MTMNKTKTPQWLLELAAQDELPKDEIRQLDARLAAEGRNLDGELAALRESNRGILARLPRDEMGAAIRSRAAARPVPKKPGFRLPLLVAPMVVAGSVAAAVLMIHGPRFGGSAKLPGLLSAPEEIVVKGDVLASPRLLVYRQKHGPGAPEPERLADGAQAARGDVLQVAYDKSPDRLFGVLLSIDGAGRITQHWPEEGALTSAPLTPVREVLLPSAYELDDAPGFERFVLVSAREAFPVAVVLDAARSSIARGAAGQSQPLPLGPGYGQASLLLHKTGKGVP
jgi:hypothetical protein